MSLHYYYKNVKSFPNHQRGAVLHFCSLQPDISLCCETTLLHNTSCDVSFTPQLLPMPVYTVWWQRHMDVSSFPKAALQRRGQGLNSWLVTTLQAQRLYHWTAEPLTYLVMQDVTILVNTYKPHHWIWLYFVMHYWMHCCQQSWPFHYSCKPANCDLCVLR